MHRRCKDRNFKQWHRYGGRGVTVCERWSDFGNFLADMGERPPDKTLDRWPNKDGGYEPGNCRWATRKEQTANRFCPEKARTHCPEGHPYEGDNLLVIRGGKARDCRLCANARNRKNRERLRVASGAPSR
jgi:hypothetical protein